jgi:hypothetical protein
MARDGTSASRSADGAKTLSPRELQFVESVATGGSLADSATTCGISLRTSARWNKRPEIQSAIRELAHSHVARARGVLAAGMVRAARSLLEMATGEREADSARVSACRAVLDTAIGLSELDVSARLEALEAAQEGNHENR